MRRKKEDVENGISRVGARLRRRRLELNMTQQQLADAIGVTKGGLSAYELDKTTPSPEKLAQLAKVLDVSEAYLYGMEDIVSADAHMASQCDAGTVGNEALNSGMTGNEALCIASEEGNRGHLTDRQIGIGEQLIRLRKERGLSSEETALMLGIPESSLERFEKDLASPSYELLIRMAKLLRVSTEQLLGISTGRILNIDELSDENKRVVREIVRNMLED